MNDNKSLKQQVLALVKTAREMGPERGPGGLEVITLESGGCQRMVVTFRFRPEAETIAPRHC